MSDTELATTHEGYAAFEAGIDPEIGLDIVTPEIVHDMEISR